MDSKNTPTFAFNNNIEVKSLNVAGHDLQESSDFNICDDIDQLMSDLSNHKSDIFYEKQPYIEDLQENKKLKPNENATDKDHKLKIPTNILGDIDYQCKKTNVLSENNNKSIHKVVQDSKPSAQTNNSPIADTVAPPHRFELKLPKRSNLPDLSKLTTNTTQERILQNNTKTPYTAIEMIKQLLEDITKDLDIHKATEQQLRNELNMATEKLAIMDENKKSLNAKYYESLQAGVHKKKLLCELRNTEHSLKSARDELYNIKKVIELISQSQRDDLKVATEKQNQSDLQRKKLIDEHITINRKMQHEIDYHKNMLNEEIAKNLEMDKKCMQINTKLENLAVEVEKHKTNEMEYAKNEKDLSEKIRYADNKVDKLEKALETKTAMIVRIEDDIKQIIKINKNLMRELDDEKSASKTFVEKDKINQDLMCELEKTKSELAYAKEQLVENTAQIKHLTINGRKEKENILRKLIDKKHQLNMQAQNIIRISDATREQINRIQSYAADKHAANLARYYQNVLEIELNTHKKERQRFECKISDLKAENKRLKKMNKVMATKGIVPDDKDVWDVFK